MTTPAIHHETITMEPRDIELPDSLMAAIGRINDPMHGLPAAEALEATVVIVHGYALWDRVSSFDPTSTRLDQEQWKKIASMLDPSVQMMWVNVGPSGAEPVRV